MQLTQAGCCGPVGPHLLAEHRGGHRQTAAWGHQRDTSHQGRIGEKSSLFLDRKKPPLLSLLLCGGLGQLRFQPGPQGRILITKAGKYLHLCGGYVSSQALWLFPFTDGSDLELIWSELWTACAQPGLGHASLLGRLSALVCGWRKKRPKAGLQDHASTSVVTPH